MLNVTDLLFARGSGITLLCFHMIIVFSDNGVKINTTISLQPISFVTPLSIFLKKKKLNKPFFKNNNNTIDCGYVLVVNILQQYFHSTNDDFLCLFIFCMMFFIKYVNNNFK